MFVFVFFNWHRPFILVSLVHNTAFVQNVNSNIMPRPSSMAYEEYLLKYSTNTDHFKRFCWPLFAVVQVFLFAVVLVC